MLTTPLQGQTSRPLLRPKARAATQSEHAPQTEEHDPQGRDELLDMDEVATRYLQVKNKRAAVKAMQDAEKDLEAIRDFASRRLRTLQAKIADETGQIHMLQRHLDANEEDPEVQQLLQVRREQVRQQVLAARATPELPQRRSGLIPRSGPIPERSRSPSR